MMVDVEAEIGEFRCPSCRRQSHWPTYDKPNCWRCLVPMIPWWPEAFRFKCWAIAATDPEWAMAFNKSCDQLREIGVYPKVEWGRPRFRCLKCGALDFTSERPPLCHGCDKFMWYAPDDAGPGVTYE